MRQGSAGYTVAEYKTEPRSKAVNVKHTADIGVKQVLTKPRPMYEGRGLEAPKSKDSTHHCGSQGRY